MVITWVTREGGRAVNEDAVGKARAKGIVCVVVSDGLGGHNGGRIASELTVNTILESFNNNPGFSKEHLSRYINDARNKVMDKAVEDPDLLYMSSTAVVLLIKGRRAIWASVGDSRLYRIQNGEICEVTEDNSIAFLDFANGDIEYDDIRKSPNQNKLTSAVGVSMDIVNYSDMCKINSSTVFVVCTDGWWVYVNEEEMESTLKTSKNARHWLQKMIEIRNEKAPEDSDNYTAAIVMC